MIERRRGRVAELHAVDPLAGLAVDPGADGAATDPLVIWCEPTDKAVVLGSRQGPDLLDLEACRRHGLDVVRRRSGGGVVLVLPPDLLWVDLVVPHGIAPDDVRGSMVWAGRLWREALAAIVPDASRLAVNELPGPGTAWSELVCFAGIGAGEVLLDGRKLVGLSQRRSRLGLRIQGLVHLAPPAIDVAELLRAPVPTTPAPVPATLDGVDPGALVDRIGHLARHLG
jgi:lipoate-protein ligase A